ncbi:hypothetical protein KSB_67580 [Ktedonobacter robiniae]|uniref:Transposase n=1 Tax=Ktedonobacter robiniae TaxID=2778365 RepID=A0ABQ3V030_9CHLR|nr:hypothetical protein KSB_67580 [Ktedonobacter robiniae]
MGGIPLRTVMHEGEPLSGLQFIGELHNAFRETLCRNKPQSGGFALPEELLPLPHNQRMNGKIEHVKQMVLEQRLSGRPWP